ncbi:unnamed protein product [Rhizophagus irregularis]|nr:unnamed protein product [Rhizophagus irregularis]
MEEVVETAKNSDFTHDDSNDVMILSNENDHVLLCSGKRYRSRTYESNSTKDTATKKIGCPFVINASCPKLKNPDDNIDPLVPILRNPKKKCGKGQPLGIKRFKSSTEIPKPKTRNQRHCRKCGKVGHYQKNCKE